MSAFSLSMWSSQTKPAPSQEKQRPSLASASKLIWRACCGSLLALRAGGRLKTSRQARRLIRKDLCDDSRPKQKFPSCERPCSLSRSGSLRDACETHASAISRPSLQSESHRLYTEASRQVVSSFRKGSVALGVGRGYRPRRLFAPVSSKRRLVGAGAHSQNLLGLETFPRRRRVRCRQGHSLSKRRILSSQKTEITGH